MRPALLLVLCVVSSTISAQDPPTPPNGFGFVSSSHAVTWSDGYQSTMDLYLPDHPAPPSGWPGMVAFHGSGGSRTSPGIVAIAQRLADSGYAVYAHDRRGSGSTVTLNPGGTGAPVPGAKLRDSAESHAQAAAFSGGVIDLSRLAATGFSGGGRETYEAAAWSGKLIPPAYTTTYPVLSAAFAWGNAIDRVDQKLPGGVLCNSIYASAVYGLGTTSSSFQNLLALDYAAEAAALASDPTFTALPELQSSTVPTFVYLAWHDSKIVPNRTIDVLQSLPPTAPRRLALGTDGHATPANGVELSLKHDLRRQWFDHYVKGIPNGIDASPFADVAVYPSNEADYLDVATHWPHGVATTWPPPGPTTSLYLRTGSALSAAAPTTVETGPYIENLPAPGYGLVQFAQINGWSSVGNVLTNLPLDREEFTTMPFPSTKEIVGRPSADLWLDATTGDFQVTAALYRVGPGNVETYLTSGTAAVRGAAPGRHQVSVSLADCATSIPAGDALRLVVENLSLHEPPGFSRIRFVPEFTSYQLTMVMEPGQTSRLSLPLDDPASRCTPAIARFDATIGVTHTLAITGGAVRAGHQYLVGLGASGPWPGTPLGSATVPVNWDALTTLGLQLVGMPNPWLSGLSGTLDPSGEAAVSITLDPAAASAVGGQRLVFSSILIDPTSGALSPSAPVTVVVAP